MSKTVSNFVINEILEEKEGYLGMLLATLNARVFGNLLIGKRTVRARVGIIRPRKKALKAGQNFNAASSFESIWNTKKNYNEKTKGFFKRNNFR